MDDAIIAVEMMAVKLEQAGARAAAFAYTSTAFPMLTGTLVTVSGFLPIALAKSSTGEYTRSIFEVSAIALIVSWFAAVVLVPLLGYHMLPEQAHRDGHAHGDEVYDTGFYRRLSGWISACIERRWWCSASPPCCSRSRWPRSRACRSSFPEFGAARTARRHALPEGASFEATLREAKRLEKALDVDPKSTTWSISSAPARARFYLPLDQQFQQPNFAQFVITAKDVETRDRLSHWLESTLASRFPTVRTRVARLENGPPVGFRSSSGSVATTSPPSAASRKSGGQGARRRPHAQRAVRLGRAAERSVSFEIDQLKARQLGVTSEDVGLSR